jgi:tetratricopeptide (TPR) repeat protein
MKRIILAGLLIFFGLIATNNLMAQSNVSKVKQLKESQEFEQAAKLIPEAITENNKDDKFIDLCGDIYFELEKYESALELYKKAYDLDDKPNYNRKIATTYSYLGKHKEALDILRKMKSKDNSVENYYALGQAYIKADSIQQATLVLTQAKEKDDNNAKIYVALGDLYFKKNVYALAQSNYEEALKLDDKLTEAREKLATCYYWQGNGIITQDKELGNQYFTMALQQYELITKKDPKNAKAYYQKGLLLFYSKQFPEAIKELYFFIGLRPSSNMGRWMLAQSLYELGQCDSAAPHLIYASENIDSVKSKAKLMLARCYFDKKNFKEASNIYASLKSTDDLKEMIDLERYARSVFQTADTTKAVELYKEIVLKDPTKCQTKMQIATLLLIKKDFDGSNWFLEKFAETCKSDTATMPKVYFYMGLNHLNAKRPDTAKTCFFKSLEVDNSSLNVRLFIGDAYSQLGKADSAKMMFQFIIENGMKDTAKYIKDLNSAYAKFSGVLLNEKNYKELNKIAKSWTEFDSNSFIAYLYLAISYQGLGDADNACKYYKKVLVIDPKNQTAKKNLQTLSCG